MPDDVQRFEREYHEYHNISIDRRREQVRLLRELEAASGVAICEVRAEQFKSFLSDQIAAGKEVTTIGKIRGMVRGYYSWAFEVRLIDAERLLELRSVSAPRGAYALGVPRPYSRAEVRSLWSDFHAKYDPAAERAKPYLKRWMNDTSRWSRVQGHGKMLQARAIIGVALCGGLRVSELFNLSVDELHFDNAYIAVPGARKNPHAEVRYRAVPWTTDEMHDWVQAWLEFRELVLAAAGVEHDRPWLSLHTQLHYAKPMRFRQFEVLLSSMGRGWEFHRCRHTAITEMLRGEYALEVVQKIAGHSNIRQTLAYAELLPSDVVRVAGRNKLRMSDAVISGLEVAA